MNKLDEQPEFGLAIEISGGAKGATFPATEYMDKYLNAYMANGGLFDQVQAAKLAGVSKQRIGQLVRAGKLRLSTLTLEGPRGPMVIEQTILGNDLRAWMEAPGHKGGRPRKEASLKAELVAA